MRQEIRIPPLPYEEMVVIHCIPAGTPVGEEDVIAHLDCSDAVIDFPAMYSGQLVQWCVENYAVVSTEDLIAIIETTNRSD